VLVKSNFPPFRFLSSPLLLPTFSSASISLEYTTNTINTRSQHLIASNSLPHPVYPLPSNHPKMTTPTPSTAPTTVADTEYDVGLSRDGDKIKDPSFYQLFGVKADASDAEIKKSYRRLAVRFHPGTFTHSLYYTLSIEKGEEELIRRVDDQIRTRTTQTQHSSSKRYRKPIRTSLSRATTLTCDPVLSSRWSLERTAF